MQITPPPLSQKKPELSSGNKISIYIFMDKFEYIESNFQGL